MRSLVRLIWRHPLGRRQAAKVLSRIVRWQLAYRILPNSAFIVPFAGQTKLVMRRGMLGATGNFYLGLHEFHDMAFACHLLRPNDLFVDVGANVGSYTVLAAGVAGASVLAYEPVQATAAFLMDNVRLNHLEAIVSVRTAALGPSAGTAAVTTHLDTVNYVIVPGKDDDDRVTHVEIVRLDDELAGRVPVLLKIDVEGFEGPVLEGAGATLRSPALLAVIAELNGQGDRFGYPDAQVRQLLEHHGFRAFGYDPFARLLTTTTTDLAHGGTADNIIFVRDPDAVNRRLAEAPSFEVLGHQL
jgi:FkbM family methyltransferase